MPTTSTKLSVGLGVFLHRQTSESCCKRRRNGTFYIAHKESFCIERCVKTHLKAESSGPLYLCAKHTRKNAGIFEPVILSIQRLHHLRRLRDLLPNRTSRRWSAQLTEPPGPPSSTCRISTPNCAGTEPEVRRRPSPPDQQTVFPAANPEDGTICWGLTQRR